MTMPTRPAHTPPHTPAEWLEVKRLYDAAQALTGAPREALIAEADVADAVRAELRSLLMFEPGQPDAQGATQGFLSAPAAATALLEGPPQTDASARAGERLGAWQIVRRLGAGGMGEVFEARRADGSFEGRAAVKLIKRGMDSQAVLQRFAQERQALARLHHPNIATLLDAGLSDDGLPYFVMAYVDGLPIDEAARGLPIEQRIALFLQLADAVAHAHRNLLVHRDLKPSNVLVTAQGEVKLLDFGIAKALSPLEGLAEPGLSANDTTLGTAGPFTPNYASPEQVRGEPVGTATDIYSLGVLLYQLLTGVRPTGRDAITPAQAARGVLDETPTRPSSLPGHITQDPHWLSTRKRLAGDLDKVLLKALEKPVARRYDSVDALVQDVRAYLAGYPVSARAATWRYVSGKFIARHRVPVAAAALAALSLVAGTGVALWQAQQARLGRDEARQRLADLRSVTHDLVFRFGDGIAYLPGGMNVKEDLLNATLAQLQRLADGPSGDAAIVADIAALHARLAELQGADTAPSTERPQQAIAHADQAIALGAQVWAQRKADRQFTNWLARAYQIRAQRQRAAGELDAALQTLTQERSLVTESLALQTRDDERAWLLFNLASTLFLESQLLDALSLPSLNRPDQALLRLNEAEQAYRDVLALGDKVMDALDASGRPEEPKTRSGLLHGLASAQEGRALLRLKHDDPALALADAQAAEQTQLQALALDPLQLPWRDGLMSKSNTLATVALRLGLAQPALQAAQRSWDAATALAKSEGAQSRWGQSLPTLAHQYGRALAAVGRHAEAVAVFESSIAAWTARAQSGPALNPNAQRRIGWMGTQLSRSQQALRRPALALGLARQASTGLGAASLQGPQARDLMLNLAEALAWQARIDPGAAAGLREQARAAYDRAGALSPLKAEHAAARAALAQAPP